MFDNHVHSNFSGDGQMSPETACETAINKGLEGIAFTDHLDYDYPSPENEFFLIDFDEYSRSMDKVKIKFEGRLKILKGIEIGIQPQVIEQSLDIVRRYDFDYVLASIHAIDGIDPYRQEYYSGKTIKEAYGRYLEEILLMVKNFNDLDNVGHFEYVTRYACYDDRTLSYNDHKDLFDCIFKEIISRGKGFEVNTGSFRDKIGIRTLEYDAAVLKRYRELGGEIVSLASDAHNSDYIGYKFEYFRELLKDAGFKYAVYFEQRKPVFNRL